MKNLLFLSLLMALVLGSCAKKETEAEQAAKAMEQMGQAMQQMSDQSGGTGAAKAPGVAIPAKTLVTFLPTLSGYEKNGDAEYMDMEMQGTKYSHASQSYTSGDKSIKVSVFDYNYIAGLAAAYGMMLNMNMETNTEVQRGEKIGGYPGWFHWQKNSNEGTIGVVVAERVFVTIDGNGGVTDAELHSIANGIDYSGIAGQVK